MADQPFETFLGSFLPAISALNGTERIPGIDASGDEGYMTSQQIADLAQGGVITTRFKLQSSDILALNSVPKVLLDAPGANKMIVLLNMSFFVRSGNTPYDTNTNLRFSLGGQIFNTSDTPLANTANTVKYWYINFPSYTINNGSNVDFLMSVTVPGGNPASGDGTVDIYLTYVIVDVTA